MARRDARLLTGQELVREVHPPAKGGGRLIFASGSEQRRLALYGPGVCLYYISARAALRCGAEEVDRCKATGYSYDE